MESTGSFYDNFDDSNATSLPPIKNKPVKSSTPFANRSNMSDPYTNGEVKKTVQIDSMPIKSCNPSLAFWRLFTKRIPIDSFEQSVNSKFGLLVHPFDFEIKKNEYIKLYRIESDLLCAGI